MTDKKPEKKTAPTGLDLLRAPFPANQISKLPKPTKKQTDEVKADFKAGIRCTECGGWHHPKVVHLDYVGHAALTDRLLDADPAWNWEPLAFTDQGLPAFDATGGLWIKLTVCGQTRLGFGHAKDKGNDLGAREKEVIGDALRNAAMRFGAALDLWHKGDLHVEEEAPEEPQKPKGKNPPKQEEKQPNFGSASEPAPEEWAYTFKNGIHQMATLDLLIGHWQGENNQLLAIEKSHPDIFAELVRAKDEKKAFLLNPGNA